MTVRLAFSTVAVLALLSGCADSPAAPVNPAAASAPRFDASAGVDAGTQTTSGGVWFGDGDGGGAVTSANSAPADSADSAERGGHTFGSGS